MMLTTELVELFLQGFEVFDEATRIPLRRLTLLFGPNSAGKSSLEHAIRLLCDICDAKDPWLVDDFVASPFNRTGQGRARALRDVWRRFGERDEQVAPELVLGAKIQGRFFLFEDYDYSLDTDKLLECGYASTLEVMTRFENLERPRPESFLSEKLSLLVDDQPLLNAATGAALNFGHSIMRAASIPSECIEAANLFPNFIVVEDGWVRFLDGNFLDANKGLSVFSFQTHWNWSDDIEGHAPPMLIAAFHAFADRFERILRNAFGHLHDGLKTAVVEASRTIPTEGELTFLVGSRAGTLIVRDRLESDPRYEALAASFAERARGFGKRAKKSKVEVEESYADRVNRIFTDYLFAERGYMLNARVYDLVELGESKKSGRDGQEAPTKPALVTLHLGDAHGRHFSFKEVGSGLGYVLPVLAEICNRERPVVFVQQPELHLHPALQAQLGDALLEEAVGRRCLIVETHSEHLLLRILKRLRNRHTIRSIGQFYEPEDVSVLYFDPHPDGSTKVKRLRIGEDGDFLDAWPRGFFADRDQDLFDE